MGLEVTLHKLSDFEELGVLWRDLELRADVSFFQSWAWTGCLARERFADPVVLKAQDDQRILALALFNLTSPCFGRSKLSLGESGDPQHDAIFIERNGILIERGLEELPGICLERVQHGGVGGRRFYRNCRIRLSGVDGEHLAAARACNKPVMVQSVGAPIVELDAVRRSGGDVLRITSPNTRAQIRRSERKYAATGPLEIVRAQTIEQAQVFLTELIKLHQKYWTGRGHPGAFANPFFERFHRELINRAFHNGGTHLLRIAAGSKIIGYLYNFCFRGHVCAYQSGFDYDRSDPHLKPGLTCHHLAIQLYIAQGERIYDFLAGAERYKVSLATNITPLHWIETGELGLWSIIASAVKFWPVRLGRRR